MFEEPLGDALTSLVIRNLSLFDEMSTIYCLGFGLSLSKLASQLVLLRVLSHRDR